VPRIKEAEKEFVRKRGEYYVKHPGEVPSIRQMRKDLIEKGINADRATIKVCLQEGVARVVGIEQAHLIYNKLWPSNEIKPDIQEIIRQIGENYARNPHHIPSIKQIHRKLAA
jgi:hypothetical protein